MWFVLTQVLLVGSPAYTAVAEAWAIAAEAPCHWAALQGVSEQRVVIAAIAASAASFFLGQARGLVLAAVQVASA